MSSSQLPFYHSIFPTVSLKDKQYANAYTCWCEFAEGQLLYFTLKLLCCEFSHSFQCECTVTMPVYLKHVLCVTLSVSYHVAVAGLSLALLALLLLALLFLRMLRLRTNETATYRTCSEAKVREHLTMLLAKSGSTSVGLPSHHHVRIMVCEWESTVSCFCFFTETAIPHQTELKKIPTQSPK